MAALTARIPNDQIFWTATMRLASDWKVEPVGDLEAHLREPLMVWLATCHGSWTISRDPDLGDHVLDFEREEDRVRYCMEWL